MIEFRKDKGPWWCCDADDECLSFAAAIAEDGVWWFVGACDNEKHIAEALAEHERRKTGGMPDEFIAWADVNPGRRLDGATWGEVA